MNFKSKLLGTVAYCLTELLYKTLRVDFVHHEDYNPKQQYLFAFWHGKQLLPVLMLRRHLTTRGVLVSPSRDGDLLTVWLKNLNYEVIRGSSRDKNISALVQMMKQLKQGTSLGFGIDGPIGPIYKVKPGMTHMAQKLGIPIIVVGSAFSRKWIVEKAWDKYQIPKPFAKGVLYLGKPMYIAKAVDLADANLELEQAIQKAEAKALALL